MKSEDGERKVVELLGDDIFLWNKNKNKRTPPEKAKGL
jgi:hypothetical protein